jgi:predicted Zn-dependent protease
MDKLPEAETAFRAAFKSDPQSAQAAYNLGILLSKSNPDEAIDWCRKATLLRPDESKYGYTLAFFQNQHNKVAEAVQILEKLIQREPADAQPYTLLAHIYEQQKKTRQALSVYRRAAANPHLPEPERARFQDQSHGQGDH